MITEADLERYSLTRKDVLFIDFAFERKPGKKMGGIVKCHRDLMKTEGLSQDLFDAVLDVLAKYGYASKKGGKPMKTIYISGKVDGCDPYDAEQKFAKACQRLLDMVLKAGHGFAVYPTIINPMKIGKIPDGSWQDYIERDLIYLKHCDTIYMLKDWKDSAGARVEHEFAKKLGLEIIYEEDGQ